MCMRQKINVAVKTIIYMCVFLSEILGFRTLSIVLVLKNKLRAETDAVSETSCFSLVCFLIPGWWIKFKNPISLKVIHHRQNPIITTYVCVCVCETVIILMQQDAYKYNIKTISSHLFNHPRQRRSSTIVVGWFYLTLCQLQRFCGWNE
jgi:hypothetical protein